MSQSAKSVKLEISQARTKAISDINMALGNLGQTMVKGFADMQLAQATGMAADQKRAEQELEETKELMSSFQDVINKVAQLAQAILQAETQSMRDAIQA
jgi:Skp family chaperone for outer membrane proteins